LFAKLFPVIIFESPPSTSIAAVGSSSERMPLPVPDIVLLATVTFDAPHNEIPNQLLVIVKFSTVTFDVYDKPTVGAVGSEPTKRPPIPISPFLQ
jgi:hypothetical protein